MVKVQQNSDSSMHYCVDIRELHTKSCMNSTPVVPGIIKKHTGIHSAMLPQYAFFWKAYTMNYELYIVMCIYCTIIKTLH